MDAAGLAWFDSEIAGCSLDDERLKTRPGDWANTKAAYRFFSNERVNEADILAGHFQSTRDRVAASNAPVFMLHDTTEFTYKSGNPNAVGITKRVFVGRDRAGRPKSHTVCASGLRFQSAGQQMN